MTRLSRAARSKYDMVIGSRVQVMNGTAHHTSGGLTKEKLFRTKNGRIVSKSKHFSAKRENRLIKAGYGTKKGKFGFVRIGKSRKQRGGGEDEEEEEREDFVSSGGRRRRGSRKSRRSRRSRR
jgi:hypothetical protein